MELFVYAIGSIFVAIGLICFLGSNGTMSVRRGYIPGIVYSLGGFATFHEMAIWPAITAFAINWTLAAIYGVKK